ncbi:hypothetical protein [Streptomyces sp. NPDC051286]|uniref:hypothetical protein n=1 Tax=Streptomyces sp. NPDC051286 TaxID=3365647 RepID=UPI0037A09CC8
MNVLGCRSSNTVHQPVIGALELVKRYAKAGNTTYYGHHPSRKTGGRHRDDLTDRSPIWAAGDKVQRKVSGQAARRRPQAG